MKVKRQTRFIQYIQGEFRFLWGDGMVMVFNVTFNNISVISWWSVLLVASRGPGENNPPVASH